MQIIDLDKDNVKINIDAITLGNFDGLHLAHQKLINKCVSLGKSGVIIFKSHTSEILEDDKFKNILITDDKINLLRRMNVDYCLIKSFDKAFLSLKPEEFLDYVKEHTNFKNLVVGKDFKFGINASGNISTLKNFQKVFNYKLYIIDDQFINGVPIRSTTIRKFLMSGEIENANSMLYRPFSINGVVIDGKHRGRNLGYPTANLECKEYIIPAAGV
ncbi:MAG: riboflavin kinase, partial [Finegoldia magna]|nr:riboflavin kinase [Finegoldia magna]